MSARRQVEEWARPRVKKTFLLTETQACRLREIARREGRSEADLARECLERILFGIDEEEQVKAQRRLRGWARQDLYEERSSRWTNRH
jgi:hypothetical protein